MSDDYAKDLLLDGDGDDEQTAPSSDPAPSAEGAAPSASPASDSGSTNYQEFVAGGGLAGRMELPSELDEHISRVAGEQISLDSPLLRKHRSRVAQALPIPTEEVQEQAREIRLAEQARREERTEPEPVEPVAPETIERSAPPEQRHSIAVIDFLAPYRGQDEKPEVAPLQENRGPTREDDSAGEPAGTGTGHDMATSRITTALDAFAALGELERDYVLDELRLVSKSMQLRALDGMSQYEEQARELAERFAVEHEELESVRARLSTCEHELLEARHQVDLLKKALGGSDSDGGAVAEATFESNGGAPKEIESEAIEPVEEKSAEVGDGAKDAAEAEASLDSAQEAELDSEPVAAKSAAQADSDDYASMLSDEDFGTESEPVAEVDPAALAEEFPDVPEPEDADFEDDPGPEMYDDDLEVPDFEPDLTP